MGAAAALCVLVLLSAAAALYSAPHVASHTTKELGMEMRRRLLQGMPARTPNQTCSKDCRAQTASNCRTCLASLWRSFRTLARLCTQQRKSVLAGEAEQRGVLMPPPGRWGICPETGQAHWMT